MNKMNYVGTIFMVGIVVLVVAASAGYAIINESVLPPDGNNNEIANDIADFFEEENGQIRVRGAAYGKNAETQIKVEVAISGGKITDITIFEHDETSGISDAALEQIPKAIIEAQSIEVDTISGATATSAGIIEAVGNALHYKGKNLLD